MRPRLPLVLACFAVALAIAPVVPAGDVAGHVTDLVYATVAEKPLALDVPLPSGIRHPPLRVFIHGGAWTTGGKSQYPSFLLDHRFAVASD
jgi:carboxylesterase type B